MQPIKLSPSQITNLAKPLVGMIQKIEEFYQDPKNEEAFQKWLLSKEEQKAKESTKTSV